MNTSTSNQGKLLGWAERHAHYRKGFSGKHYSPYICHIMNLFDKRVHGGEYHCHWISPYGFVPEAGCPLHD